MTRAASALVGGRSRMTPPEPFSHVSRVSALVFKVFTDVCRAPSGLASHFALVGLPRRQQSGRDLHAQPVQSHRWTIQFIPTFLRHSLRLPCLHRPCAIPPQRLVPLQSGPRSRRLESWPDLGLLPRPGSESRRCQHFRLLDWIARGQQLDARRGGRDTWCEQRLLVPGTARGMDGVRGRFTYHTALNDYHELLCTTERKGHKTQAKAAACEAAIRAS